MNRSAFRILKHYEEIVSARKLLYNVYIGELKWNFVPENPSGIHVRELPNGEKMLCDHFDDHAVWIGTFEEEKLVGVSRTLTRENKFGKLDIELYDTKEELSKLKKMKERCIEFQRVAISKEYREKRNFPLEILSFNLDFAKKGGFNILCSSNLKYVHSISEEFGFKCLQDKFFYGEENELPASVYCLSFDKIDDAIKKMKDLGIEVTIQEL